MANDANKRETFLVDQFCCQCCGSEKDIVIHHITPRSADGGDGVTNLLTLCRLCEKQVHAKTPHPSGAHRSRRTRAQAFNIGLLRELRMVPRRYPRSFYFHHRLRPRVEPSGPGLWLGMRFDHFQIDGAAKRVYWTQGVEITFRRVSKGTALLGKAGEVTEA